jgi:hypothetical protein
MVGRIISIERMRICPIYQAPVAIVSGLACARLICAPGPFVGLRSHTNLSP